MNWIVSRMRDGWNAYLTRQMEKAIDRTEREYRPRVVKDVRDITRRHVGTIPRLELEIMEAQYIQRWDAEAAKRRAESLAELRNNPLWWKP